MEHQLTYDPLTIVHWTYTREEWKAYQHWAQLKKGYWNYCLFRIRRRHKKTAPEIRITPSRIWTNDLSETFRDDQFHFRNANIHDTGNFNIIEISYENSGKPKEIVIPIPKGKLREAMEVMERISGGR